MRSSISIAAMAVAMLLSVDASAQDVVMRRPLPLNAQQGSSSTPTTTPPNESPPPGAVVEDHPNPTVGVCDQGASSPEARLVSAQWIPTDWKTVPGSENGSCTTQQLGFACQTTYACQVDGADLTFTDLGPASLCPDAGAGLPPGQQCPPGWLIDPSAVGGCAPPDGPSNPGQIG